MNTLLYASLSVNGLVLRAQHEGHTIPNDIMADFMKNVTKAGNLLLGRKTFELLLQNPAARQGFSGIELIVLSTQLKKTNEFTVASSPQEALDYLREKGFENVLISGGGQVYSAFLGANLVDELVLNITPLISGSGGDLLQRDAINMSLQLLDVHKLTDQVVQLRYKINRD